MPVNFDDLAAAGVDPAIVSAFRGLSDDLIAIMASLEQLTRPGLRPARMDDLARIANELHRLRVMVSGQSGAGVLALDAKAVADRVAGIVGGISVEVLMDDGEDGPGGEFDPATGLMTIRVPEGGAALSDDQIAAMERVPDIETAQERADGAVVLALDLGDDETADLLAITSDGLDFIPSKAVADRALERGEIDATELDGGVIDLITINGAPIMRLHPDRSGPGGEFIRGGVEIVAYEG